MSMYSDIGPTATDRAVAALKGRRRSAGEHLTHVACVDDDPDILTVARFALELVGNLRVTTFAGARTALEGIEAANPDLLLLDVMMPELDGPATFRALTTRGVTTPVVFMTARVQPEEVRHYIALGAIGVIRKPFDAMTVAQDVHDIWRNRRHN